METEKTLKFPVSMYFQPKQVKIGQSPGALGNHPECWVITRSVGQSPGVLGNHSECRAITGALGNHSGYQAITPRMISIITR